MYYELMSSDDYDNLPENPEKQFLEIEQICRKSMNYIMEDASDTASYNVRLQYMMTVASAAAELGVPDVQYPDEINNIEYDFEHFLQTIYKVMSLVMNSPKSYPHFLMQQNS